MLPYNHSIQICGDAMGPKYAFIPSINGKGMPKSSRAILKLMAPVGIRYPPNLMPKRENRILLATQMKGAYLSMKPPHQSLPNPHGIQRDPYKILESLLYQEIRIACGSQDQTAAKERWTKDLNHGSCRAATFKIRSYPLAHAFNKNLDDKK